MMETLVCFTIYRKKSYMANVYLYEKKCEFETGAQTHKVNTEARSPSAYVKEKQADRFHIYKHGLFYHIYGLTHIKSQ